ncbi:hypothetical protein FA95DRAFT_1611359 [Auriscalpium vulgare]|uniref:Uncharacterized protein n=1 Tax=Auriscalpium vulgare TaxID=40419 RepID=A0ACB8R9Z1_9AGAM|nr:hypothetical protein FA95DRAFT_1611359 [Auriscalpium vulgare]
MKPGACEVEGLYFCIPETSATTPLAKIPPRWVLKIAELRAVFLLHLEGRHAQHAVLGTVTCKLVLDLDGIAFRLMRPALLPAMTCNPRSRLPEHHRVHGPGPRSSENGVWMKSWTWWLLLAVNTVQGFAYFLPIIWSPMYASSVGSTSTSSLCIMGELADHISPWLLAISTLGSPSIVTFALWGIGGRDTPLLLLFGVLYGLFAAGWSSLWTGFLRLIARDDPALSTTLFGFLLFSRGVGNLLSTPISTALSTRPDSVVAHEKTGFDVADGRFGRMIVYVGTCFAGAAVVAMVGWAGTVF